MCLCMCVGVCVQLGVCVQEVNVGRNPARPLSVMDENGNLRPTLLQLVTAGSGILMVSSTSQVSFPTVRWSPWNAVLPAMS